MSLGYSHDVIYVIPDKIKIECVKNSKIIVSGVNKMLVGDVAEKLCNFRKYDPYKGKGILYNKSKYKIRKSASKK